MSPDEKPGSVDVTKGDAAFTVEKLTTGYNGMPIVHEVSLVVRAGETACVVGPNGCGKSTLLKALAGLLPVFSGSVSMRGIGEVTGRSTPELVRAGVGYVPQVNDVFAPLSVEENLEVGGYPLRKAQVTARKRAVLEMFPRLGDMLSRHAGRLSGGERKMLAMARVLMLEPSVLLLDEPTAGLTEEMATRLLDGQLADLKASGIAVLLVEQRANLALHSADRAYVLSSGRVRREGDAADLRNDPSFAHIFLGGASEGLSADPTLASEA
jgi:ABC-type branched-subunit amino acid transport system ATPase component